MKKLTCLITLFLFISVGYINAETMLERISKIYGHGVGATGARSLKIEDVNIFTDQEYMDLVDNAIKSINTKTNLNLVRKGKKIILGKSN